MQDCVLEKDPRRGRGEKAPALGNEADLHPEGIHLPFQVSDRHGSAARISFPLYLESPKPGATPPFITNNFVRSMRPEPSH